MSAVFENFRTIKITLTFDGLAGTGANGALSTNAGLDSAFNLDEAEFIYDVFYRVTTTLTSGDLAGTYLELGIQTDDTDAILNSTTGVLNTLNTNAAGFRVTPAFTKAVAPGRDIVGNVGGTNDITGGVVEVILTVARANRLPETEAAAEDLYDNLTLAVS